MLNAPLSVNNPFKNIYIVIALSPSFDFKIALVELFMRESGWHIWRVVELSTKQKNFLKYDKLPASSIKMFVSREVYQPKFFEKKKKIIICTFRETIEGLWHSRNQDLKNWTNNLKGHNIHHKIVSVNLLILFIYCQWYSWPCWSGRCWPRLADRWSRGKRREMRGEQADSWTRSDLFNRYQLFIKSLPTLSYAFRKNPVLGSYTLFYSRSYFSASRICVSSL